MHDVDSLSRLLDSRDQFIRYHIVQPLISEALIHQHERAAAGYEPSRELWQVLEYLGRHPDRGAPRYNIVIGHPGGPFLVARNLRRRSIVPSVLVRPTFETLAEARHRAFLLQLADYGLADPAGALSVDNDIWQEASTIRT